MKDLAKRFYMLLYVFLTRRYRHVEIVFIRHTHRAEEVDEDTFLHGPASDVSMSASRATINTILRRLAKQLLIELRYRSIFVADSKRLR
jgi:uncharacterized sporulation protein YeaH/YhbH (DUF444 family)